MTEGRWHSFLLPSGLGVGVRFTERDGRLVATEMYLQADEEISTADLRSVPLGRYDAEVNSRSRLERLNAELLAERPDQTVDDMREAFREGRALKRRHRARKTPKFTPLKRPDGTNPEAFYAAVAERYQEYAAETHAPAPRIAEESGVPVTTVHRWIREARRRGFLPPGRKGRRG